MRAPASRRGRCLAWSAVVATAALGAGSAGAEVVTPAEMAPMRATLADLERITYAIGGWIRDQVSLSAPETLAPCHDLFPVTDYPPISHADLAALLVPDYIDALPALDGWGRPFEFRLSMSLLAPRATLVRSAGADGVYDTSTYVRGEISDLAEDLVMADLSYIRRPGPVLLNLRARLSRALREIERMNVAMLSWVTDMVSLAALTPSSPVDLELFDPISAEELDSLLIVSCTFYYTSYVPLRDPWGKRYEYWLDVDDLLGMEVLALRSRGRDGLAEGNVYEPGIFPAWDLDRDIVYADGLAIRTPDLEGLVQMEDFETGDFRHWSALAP